MTRVLSTITKNGLSTFFQELANILLMLRLETYTFTRKKKKRSEYSRQRDWLK
jgi:predicted glycosyltransferase involved in capsule biosynthesis